MKRWILAALVSGALLASPIANAEELMELPEASPKSDAALLHAPKQGPQENEKASGDRESAKSKAPEQDNASEKGTQELSTTTMAATSESGAADTAAPDTPISVNGEALAYDGNGNLIARGSKAYTYDGENRLTSVNGSVFFAYGPDGERIRKSDSFGSTLYPILRETGSSYVEMFTTTYRGWWGSIISSIETPP